MGVKGQYWLGGERKSKCSKIGRVVFVWRRRVKIAESRHDRLPSRFLANFYFVSPARHCYESPHLKGSCAYQNLSPTVTSNKKT